MKKAKARTRVHRKKMKGGAHGELSDKDKKVLQKFLIKFKKSREQIPETIPDLELSLENSIIQLYNEINKGAPVGKPISCPLPANNRAIKVLIPTLIEKIRDNPKASSDEILKKTINDIPNPPVRGGKNLIQKGGAFEVTDVIRMADPVSALPIIIGKSGIEVVNLLPNFDMGVVDKEGDVSDSQ